MPPFVRVGRGTPVQQSTSLITQIGRGRGVGRAPFPDDRCICTRPHCGILCHICGYLGWGRIKYSCPQHLKTIFLIDMYQCPNCRAYAQNMTEF